MLNFTGSSVFTPATPRPTPPERELHMPLIKVSMLEWFHNLTGVFQGWLPAHLSSTDATGAR